MAKVKTFVARGKDGELTGIVVKYSPLMVIAGNEAHELALHMYRGEWTVSDPKVGAKVCDVPYRYKGMPVSGTDKKVGDMLALAVAAVDSLIERIGTDNFNQVLRESREKYKDKK